MAKRVTDSFPVAESNAIIESPTAASPAICDPSSASPDKTSLRATGGGMNDLYRMLRQSAFVAVDYYPAGEAAHRGSHSGKANA